MEKNSKVIELLDKHFGTSDDGRSWFTMDNYEEPDVIYLVCCSLDDTLELARTKNYTGSQLDFEFAKNLFMDFLSLVNEDFFNEPISQIVDMFNSIPPFDKNSKLKDYTQQITELKTVLSKYVEYM
jgi:hypothetical protein